MSRYDTVVANGRVVLPGLEEPAEVAIRIPAGRIVAIAEDIPSTDAHELIDARGLAVLPGAVDSHFHIGIYRPIEQDAASETESSLVGGATSVISYFRTGTHYLAGPAFIERSCPRCWRRPEAGPAPTMASTSRP